jgi:outer membrane protein TolC
MSSHKWGTLIYNLSMKRFTAAIPISMCIYLHALSGFAEEAGAAETGLKRLTLTDCIALALSNSRTLMAERRRLEAMDALVKQAYWKPFSQISVNATFSIMPDKNAEKIEGCTDGSSPVDGECTTGKYYALWSSPHGECTEDNIGCFEGSWGPTFRAGAKAVVPLFTFGKVKNAWDAVKSGQKAKEAEFPRFAHRVSYQVEQAYHAISGAREMLYTIDKGRGHLTKARRKVEKDLEAQVGTSTQIDLIKLKVYENEIGQLEAQVLEIERSGLAALRFLVGGMDGTRIDIVDEPQMLTDEELGSLDKYKDIAVRNRPELKALRSAVRAMESKVKLRKSEFFPDLVAFGGFNYAVTPGRDDIDSWFLNDSHNSGVGFVWGISLHYKLDVGLDIYRHKAAKAELAALAIDEKAALEGVMLEVENVYHHLEAMRSSLELMQRSRRLVKGWISATMQNHAVGLASTKEVKDALKEYFKVMASLHKSTNDYNVGIAELKRVTGAFESDR